MRASERCPFDNFLGISESCGGISLFKVALARVFTRGTEIFRARRNYKWNKQFSLLDVTAGVSNTRSKKQKQKRNILKILIGNKFFLFD